MKKAFGLLLLGCLLAGGTVGNSTVAHAQAVNAQAGKPAKHHHAKKTAVINDQSNPDLNHSNINTYGIDRTGLNQETSMNPGAAPGDPYNLNHPFFNGEARWSDADSLYKHGDFPWALVQKNPDNFHFNAQTGKWDLQNTETMGKTTPSR